jgi:hypothetical protein
MAMTWRETKAPIEYQNLNEDQKRMLDCNENFFSDGLETRRAYEIAWYRNMAFFLGYHYIEWDNYKGTLKVPMKPSWRVRAVINHIQSNVMHTVAKLTKNKSIFTPVPADSTNDMATNANQVAKRILFWIQQNNKTSLAQQDLYMMMYLYGTAYKQIFWNINEGEPIIFMPEKDGKRGQRLYTGDVGIRVLSPFEVVWEEGAVDIRGSQRIGILFTKSLEEIRNDYKWGKYVKAEMTKNSSSMESTMMSLMHKKFVSQSDLSRQADKKDGEDKTGNGFATIKQYMELPSDKYPRGRMIMSANGILLDEQQELPYEFMIKYNTFGIQKYDYIHLHERWVGETPVNQQIPIQVKINRTHSAIQEIENEMVKPKWLVHKLSQVQRTSIDNEPGEIIKHNTPVGYPEPHPIQGVEIPVTLFKSTEVDSRNMEIASNLHETSKGMAVPGVESKVAMQFLQEADQTVYAPVQSSVEILDEELYTWTLELAREKYRESRKLEVIGVDNEMETYYFEASDKFSTKVKVIPGSSFPTMLAAKQQTLLNFLMGGAFGNLENIPEGLRMRIMTAAEVGDVDSIYAEMRIDIREAQREHRLWEKGQIPPPNEWDNHSVMAREHNNFRKSDTYRLLQERAPELALAIDQHIAYHEQNTPEYLASQQQQKMMEEEKQIALQDKAYERSLKEAEIKGKDAERMLALQQAQTGKKIGTQTVKE